MISLGNTAKIGRVSGKTSGRSVWYAVALACPPPPPRRYGPTKLYNQAAYAVYRQMAVSVAASPAAAACGVDGFGRLRPLPLCSFVWRPVSPVRDAAASHRAPWGGRGNSVPVPPKPPSILRVLRASTPLGGDLPDLSDFHQRRARLADKKRNRSIETGRQRLGRRYEKSGKKYKRNTASYGESPISPTSPSVTARASRLPSGVPPLAPSRTSVRH